MSGYAVLMAIKNGENYVEGALNSIIRQTLPPSEIIVVDDGSTDGSRSIIEKFGIAVIESRGNGQAAALNTGLDLVKSNFVSFLDCDDYWGLEKQNRQVYFLENNKEIDYVFCQVNNIDLFGNTLNMGPSRILGACTLRRHFIEKVGYFDEVLKHHAIVEWWGRKSASLGIGYALENADLFRLIHGKNSTILEKSAADSALLAAVRTNLKKNI